MYLARLRLSSSRIAVGWAANPYRVHQRLMMAYEGDPRLLFRIEEAPDGTQIIVQSRRAPQWERAFGGFPVLLGPPEHKAFEAVLRPGERYRFRLLANPTVKRDGKRLGLLREEEQRAWLARKLQEVGARLLGCRVASRGLQRSGKNPYKEAGAQTHLAVLFEGILQAEDSGRLQTALANGIGSAKGYGFGLLSLARAQ